VAALPSIPLATPPPAPAGALYRLRTADGKEEELERDEVVQRIRSRRILPPDRIGVAGGGETAVRDLPELAPFFVDPRPVDRSRCWNHPGALAKSACTICGRGYCEGCGASVGGRLPLRFCPACEGPVEAPDPRIGAPPFWGELGRVLLFPIERESWATTGGIAILMALGRVFFPFTTPLYLIGVAWILHVIAFSAKGKTELGVGPDVSHPADLCWRGLTAIGVLVAAFLPVAVLDFWALGSTLAGGRVSWALVVALNFPLIALGWAYVPMALGMVAVWHGFGIAFRPHLVVGAIMKIPRDYLMLLAFGFALSAAILAVSVPLGWIPVLGGIVAGFLEAWGAIAFAHALGRTLWRNERLLGWD
jgi:hypothetical protein